MVPQSSIKDKVDAILTHKPKKDKMLTKVFIIPNVDGNYEQLVNILYRIDREAPRAENDIVLFLGDIVGDNEFTRETIEFLMKLQQSSYPCLFVKGDKDYRFVKCKTKFVKHMLKHSVLKAYTSSQSGFDAKVFNNHRVWVQSFQPYTKFKTFMCSHGGFNSGKKTISSMKDEEFIFNNVQETLGSMSTSEILDSVNLITAYGDSEKPKTVKTKKITALSSGKGTEQKLYAYTVDLDDGSYIETIKLLAG